MRHSSCRFVRNRDPGFFWSQVTGTPDQQRTVPQVLHHSASKTRVNALMALRPGNETFDALAIVKNKR
jgi:hypothetical protein